MSLVYSYNVYFSDMAHSGFFLVKREYLKISVVLPNVYVTTWLPTFCMLYMYVPPVVT